MQNIPPDKMPDQTPAIDSNATLPDTQALAGSAPSTNRRFDLRLISAIMGGFLIVFLIAMTALARSNTPPPSPAQILANAEKASLHDATFTMNGTLALALGQNASSSSTPSTASNISGNGEFSNDQKAAQVHVTIPIISAQSAIDMIALPGNSYIKITGLPTGFGIPQQWIYVPAGKGGTVDFKSLYTSLQNVTYIDAVTVNGIATWHIRGDVGSKSAGMIQGKASTAIPQKMAIDLWIAQDTYFPVRVSTSFGGNLGALSKLIPMPNLGNLPGSQGAANAPTTPTAAPVPAGGSVNMSIDVIFANWNKGVTIAAPPADQVVNISSLNLQGLTGLGKGLLTPLPTPTK